MRASRIAAYESTRTDIQAAVPHTARRVLDLGCASGHLGAALKRRQGAEVVGIELLEDYARDASERLDRVVVGDVEALLADPAKSAALGRFDCLIAADVLEHLRDPWTALARAAALVEPGGTVIVSVPNVRYAGVFVKVFLRGRWPREDHGIFDRTHLRWFTLADALDLLSQAGIRPVEVRPNVWLTDGLPGLVARALRRTALGWFVTGQYVLRGVRAQSMPPRRS